MDNSVTVINSVALILNSYDFIVLLIHKNKNVDDIFLLSLIINNLIVIFCHFTLRMQNILFCIESIRTISIFLNALGKYFMFKNIKAISRCIILILVLWMIEIIIDILLYTYYSINSMKIKLLIRIFILFIFTIIIYATILRKSCYYSIINDIKNDKINARLIRNITAFIFLLCIIYIPILYIYISDYDEEMIYLFNSLNSLLIPIVYGFYSSRIKQRTKKLIYNKSVIYEIGKEGKEKKGEKGGKGKREKREKKENIIVVISPVASIVSITPIDCISK